MAITTKEFDKLLNMTMLSLDDREYDMYLRQMDQIIWFMDKLKELDIKAESVKLNSTFGPADTEGENWISLDRDYHTSTIWLSNVQHPISGNMVQIKFKRG